MGGAGRKSPRPGAEQPCMNCGAIREKDRGRYWEGVPVCIECYELATAVVGRLRSQMEHLMTVQRDKIRQCLVEGKLVLHGLHEDAKLIVEGVHPSMPQPPVQEGSDAAERGELAPGDDPPETGEE
jgi:hypothetical protein